MTTSNNESKPETEIQPLLRQTLWCLSVCASAFDKQVDPSILLADSLLVTQSDPWSILLRGSEILNIAPKKQKNCSWGKLNSAAGPFIVLLDSGNYAVVTEIRSGMAVLFEPDQPNRHHLLSKERLQEIWSGEIITFTSKTLERTHEKFDVRWFIPALLKQHKKLRAILVAAALVQMFGIAAPIFSQVIIDKVLTHRSISTLNVLATGMLIVIALEALVTWSKTTLATTLGTRLDILLAQRVIEHLLRLPMVFFEGRKQGALSVQVRQIEQIRRFLTGASVGVILDAVFSTIFVAIMLVYSWQLMLIVFCMLPLYIFLARGARPILKARLAQQYQSNSKVQALLTEIISGMQTAKSLGVERQLAKRWGANFLDFALQSRQADLTSATTNVISTVLQQLMNLLILWSGANLVLDGKITVGELFAFQMISSRFVQPISRLFQYSQELEQTKQAIDQLGDIMNSRAEAKIGEGKVGQIHGHIKMVSVGHMYPGRDKPAINELSLEISKGDIVAFVGKSGSGKSTITKLIQRLYFASAGMIYIDGVDVRNHEIECLRRQVCAVMQDNFLFDGTILENIKIAYPLASLQEVEAAANIAVAHDFIKGLPNAYETQIGERGHALSGGQRQRIALARAILGNPPVLILDEATSALDFRSEKQFYENLAATRRGMTTLIVTHRPAPIKIANRIYVMDEGRLLDFGHDDELRDRCQIYSELIRGENADAQLELSEQ